MVAACRAHGTSIVTQGGNTGLVGGSVPDASGRQVLLSTARLNRVRSVDGANLTLVAEAGCVLQRVQEAAATHGLMFALSLAAEGSCTIGGNLATNAGGTQVLRYGNARELCLGLEVVTAEGRIWDGLSALRKDNTGYDLRDLLIGSEGTLAIITAAALKLHPRPAATLTALATLPTLAAATALLALAHERLGPGLTGFEVMNAFSLELVRRHFAAAAPAARAGALDGADRALRRRERGARERPRSRRCSRGALERGLIDDTAVAASIEQANAMWHLRESIPLAQSAEGANVKHDIALPISAIEEFVAATDAALARAFPGVRLVDFGHLGDGNLHYNVQGPSGQRRRRLRRPPRSEHQRHRLRRGGGARRLDLGRARHRRSQARGAGRAQVAGRARHDAGDQARARSDRRAEPGARAVSCSQAVKSRTSGLAAAAADTTMK